MLSYLQMEDTLEKLKEIMRKTDITYKWLKKETGISEKTIRRWLKGEHKPNPVLFSELKKVVDRLYDLTFGKLVCD